MRFTALDFETANSDRSSICQIGVVSFIDGSVAKTWQRLVNPEVPFGHRQVSIHHITCDAVKGAPTFPELFAELKELLTGQVVVHHGSFDLECLDQTSEKYGLPAIECTCLDSTKVVRQTWPAHAHKGYDLATITRELGIVFKHHDAQEDARAAGEVILHALAETGGTLEDLLGHARQPNSAGTRYRTSGTKGRIAREGNPDGPLAGEVAVITGTLPRYPKQEAAELAANAGCTVAKTVTQKTTLLIVGDPGAGRKKTKNHRDAEKLIEKGQKIRIISSEDEFRRLLQIEDPV